MAKRKKPKPEQPAQSQRDRSPEFLRALAKREQHILEARNDVNCFIEYCLTDNHGQPLRQGKIHREWQALGDRYNRLLIVGPKQHGKCLIGGSRILAADGSMVPIEEWAGGELIAWDSDRWEFKRASSSPVIENGTRGVFELRTATGRTIRATANHPLFTPTGWTELGELYPGKFIGIPRGVGCLDSSGKLSDLSFSWDRVGTIRSIGEAPTYDISVPDLNSFIADGVIVHNSGQAIGRSLFKLGRDKNEMIKIICAADSKAMKRMDTIRENVLNNDCLHRVFPHLHPRGVRVINKKHLYLERPSRSPEPSVEAKGITSSATGDRATGLVADDAVDYRNSIMQPKMRASIKDGWGDWYSLLSPDGWLFWISNLWSRDDLTHELMSNKAYAVARYEINAENFGSYAKLPDGRERFSDEPLWPEYWSKERLMEERRVHKAQGFARLYSLRPMSEMGMGINKKFLRPWSEPPGDDWVRLLILDPAESESARADFTGAVELAISPDSPKIKVVDGYHHKIDFTGKVQLIRSEHQLKRFSDIALEKSAGGISLVQHLTAHYRLPMRLIPVEGRRKEIWLDMAAPYIKSGVVEFNPWLLENTGQLGERGDTIAEISNFGSYPTDDILDALTRGIYYATTVYPVFDEINDLQPVEGDGSDVSIGGFADDDDDFEVILL